MSFSLAYRYLRGRPMRALLTTVAVVLGVALIFGLNGVLPAAIQAFQRNLLATTGTVDVTVANADGAFFDPSIADRVSSVRGIADATPIVRRNLGLPKGSPVNAVTVVGADPTGITRVRSFPMAEGRFLAPTDRGTIAVSQGLAERAGLRIGSTFSMPGAGGIQEFKVVGIIGIPSVPGAEEVFVPLADAQQLFATSGEVNEVDASLLAGTNRNLVEAAVRRRLGEDYTTAGVDTTSQLFASIRVSQFAFTMFGVFALVMAGFIILNTFRTVVAERRHDIGMLRAVGAPRKIILGMFLVEAAIQGTIGVTLGLLLGWAIAFGFIAALNPIYGQFISGLHVGPPVFSAGTWAIAIFLGLTTTMIGALSPALSASRIQPMEALRPHVESVTERHRHIVPWMGLGLVLISGLGLLSGRSGAVGAGSVGVLVGLVMLAPLAIAPISRVVALGIQVVLPAEGELARSNTVRQPGRAAATASAVMLSLAIIVALLGVIASLFAGFFAYLDKSVTSADYVVLPAGLILTGSVGANQDFVNAIEDTPGVGDVATLRVGRASYNGTAVQAVGIDPREYPKVVSFDFSQGSDRDIDRLVTPRTVIANGVFAGQSGVKPGDILTLDTPTGNHDYRVLAVANDYLNAKLATLYISQDGLLDDFGVATNGAVLINASPGANKAAVKSRLSRFVARYPQFAFYDTESFRSISEDTFAQTLVIFYLLIAVLAVPSFIALLNTLAISVLARTRELGMLRAVGSTRGQVSRMVLAESILLASVGVLFGVLGGVALGYALVLAMNAYGFTTPYFFPWGGIVAAVVIGVGAAILAALIPARSASKLDIVEALHFE